MIRKDIKQFIATLPSDVILVAATKYGDVDDLKDHLFPKKLPSKMF